MSTTWFRRDVAGALGDVAGEARIALDVLDYERLARREHEPCCAAPPSPPEPFRSPREDQGLLLRQGV